MGARRFNGLFGELLCLSHGATSLSQSGVEITTSPGLRLTAFDEDADEHGDRDDLVASGKVEASTVTSVLLGRSLEQSQTTAKIFPCSERGDGMKSA